MKIEEAREKINDFLKVKEIAFFVLEKDSIHIELKKSELEAIRILMTKFEQLQKENEELREEIHNKKIIAPSRRKKKNTYEFGLIVGTKREREYWQNKIKEKIEELKSDEEKLKQDEDYVPIYQIKSKIKVLQELLKGE